MTEKQRRETHATWGIEAQGKQPIIRPSGEQVSSGRPLHCSVPEIASVSSARGVSVWHGGESRGQVNNAPTKITTESLGQGLRVFSL